MKNSLVTGLNCHSPTRSGDQCSVEPTALTRSAHAVCEDTGCVCSDANCTAYDGPAYDGSLASADDDAGERCTSEPCHDLDCTTHHYQW